ncbi:hypothetical protein C9439_06485 [archaeon SCG-AAA382B04]|nr:hypothetical protein C9439_06485 [archaeon SCG-AAA382B04]
MKESEVSNEETKFYSDAIGIKIDSDYLEALDIEWVLRKVQKASKNALIELKEEELKRVPMEMELQSRKKFVFILLPCEVYDSLDDIFKLTTLTFRNLVDMFERARNRENIKKITIERLGYDGNKFSVAECDKIIFKEERKEKPLTEF